MLTSVKTIKISETNRVLISDFMGEKYPAEIDFNWLMPVVEKIDKMHYIISIIGNTCEIKTQPFLIGMKDNAETHRHHRLTIEITRDTKIQSVFRAVLECIKSHNQTKTKC